MGETLLRILLSALTLEEQKIVIRGQECLDQRRQDPNTHQNLRVGLLMSQNFRQDRHIYIRPRPNQSIL